MDQAKLLHNRKTDLFSNKDVAICLGASILLSFLSITNQSLWIDESITASLASYPTFGKLLYTQLYNTTKETQSHLPFYIWYIWGWAKLFGINELSLRIANFPFIVILLSVIQWGSKIIFKNEWNWSIALVSPFVWFYMNEARPYVAVMAFSSLSIICFLFYLTKPSQSNRLIPWLCLVGVFFASGMVSFNILLIPVFFITLAIRYKFNRDKWRNFFKDWLWPSFILSPFFIMLGAWFVWALIHKPNGDVIGTNLVYIKKPGILNLLFSMYEFFGFLGLGPPRNIIRSALGLNTFLPYILSLSVGVIGWIVSFIIIVKSWHHNISEIIIILIEMFCVGILMLFSTFLLFHFRFWGRHFAMLFPIFLFIVIGTITDGPGEFRNKFLKHIAFCVLIIIWLSSSIRLTYLSEYKKDDYRSAVSYAINAAGNDGSILWAANRNCGQFYGLKFINELTPKRVFRSTTAIAAFAVDWDKEKIDNALQSYHHPIIIVISKPDLHDKTGALTIAVKENKAQLVASLNAFKIYKIY